MNWSYGITTVPSRVDNGLLNQTVDSLKRAGFELPTLFIDGPVECLLELPLVIYCPPVGHLPNWMKAIFHLYVTNPTAERYALFEDDLLACSNLKEYLERCSFPPRGYLNLLTHNENLIQMGPMLGWHTSNQRGRGAVGLVFDQQGVKELLSSPVFINRPATGPMCADGMVIETLQKLGYTEYTHNPSLLQHTGLVSTFPEHKYGNVIGFHGEDYNPLTLLEDT